MPAARRVATDEALRDWNEGDTRAERLAAAILRLDGYDDIDPQHPLGGPDGGRDLICNKGGRTFVAAVYFPHGDKSFATIKRKFKADLQGVIAAGRDAIVFVTNQKLTQSQRSALGRIAADQGKICEPIHRERIRVHLDAASGYGVRLEHLRIEMTPEEQFAYFAEAGGKVELAIERQTREIRSLAVVLEQIARSQLEIESSVSQLLDQVHPTINTSVLAATPDLVKASDQVEPVTSNLTIGFILAVHRLVCKGMPAGIVGQLRQAEVWIAGPSGETQSDTPQPLSPDRVNSALHELLSRWNAQFSEVKVSEIHKQLQAISEFHAEFQKIHPFMDGNGRTGRALLVQQCIDVMGQADDGLLDRGVAYQNALRSAIRGDHSALMVLIEKIVHG